MFNQIGYNPYDWYWIVGSDDNRYWSSEMGAYVEQHPDGAGITRIISEAELDDVLAVYGLPGPLSRPYWLYRSTFIERLTNREAGMLEQVLAGADAKLRLMYNSVEYFVSDDPLFAVLHFAVSQALGIPRADELLGKANPEELAELAAQQT